MDIYKIDALQSCARSLSISFMDNKSSALGSALYFS